MEELSPLERFGRAWVQRTYDPSLWMANALIDGKLKGDRAYYLREALSGMSPEARETVQLLAPVIIEEVMFRTLFFLDEEEVNLRVDGESAPYIHGELAGWLFNEDGWIARFSRERQREQG